MTCVPNASSCVGDVATVCDSTGTAESTFACVGPGMKCEADGCHGECSPVNLGMGYIGCEFWPTVTSNPVWTDRAKVNDGPAGFHFGVLLGNVSTDMAATVTIGSSPTTEQTYTIAPGETRTVALDWIHDLKGADWDVPYQPASPTQSIKKANGAYRVQSNRPIIAYQLNALENEIARVRGCPTTSTGSSSNCYAYSSDGSLLLPAHVLSSKYVVAGFHAWHKEFANLPGATYGRLNMGDFISITSPQANTEVKIKLRPNQTILSGPDIPRVNSADNSVTHTLGQYQVAQLFTPGTSDNDSFAGAVIETKEGKPVQVLSGVGCVNISDDESPCGHIEDAVLPVEALGKDYVVPVVTTSGAMADAGTAVGQTIRVQSISDGTAITFEPKLYNPVTLSSGDALDIPNVTTDLRISSTTPFAVTQYLTGRGSGARQSESAGSPNQLTIAPASQYRTSYTFAATNDFGFGTSYLMVTAPTGAMVKLDTQAIPSEKFLAVGASGMSVARVPVSAGKKVHTVTADKPVGIVVYGIGPYSSYAFTGGLDVKRPGPAVVR
ncbi:MAG: IgGFc-binding protein [Polyangiaceae bacterium]